MFLDALVCAGLSVLDYRESTSLFGLASSLAPELLTEACILSIG